MRTQAPDDLERDHRGHLPAAAQVLLVEVVVREGHAVGRAFVRRDVDAAMPDPQIACDTLGTSLSGSLRINSLAETDATALHGVFELDLPEGGRLTARSRSGACGHGAAMVATPIAEPTSPSSTAVG